MLAGSASAPGFAAAAGELIAELQRSLITPQRFAQALTAWAAQDGGAWDTRSELASLYRAYVRELERLGPCRCRALHLARDRRAASSARALGHGPRCSSTASTICCAIERDAVETLARIVGVEVTVSLTYEPRARP